MPQQPQKPAGSSYQDRHAYIPPHVEQAMTKQMEHALPAHMKRYAGAYVQQNMTGPGMATSGKMTGPPAGYKPVTHLPRKDHFHQYKAQQPSKADAFLSQNTPPAPAEPGTVYAAQSPQPQATQDPAPPQQIPEQPVAYPPQNPSQPASGPTSNYDFFMGAEQQQIRKPSPLSNSSLPIRIGLVAGGLVALLIIFNVAKGLLAGPSVLPYYVTVTQDQQEIIHLSSDATELQTDINTTNKNFAATAQLSVTSAQADIIKLLSKNGRKVKVKELNLKLSDSTDARLKDASAAGTYNETFKDIMLSELKTYMSDLKTTYNHSKSDSGRALLSDKYHQAELLTEQLNSDQ